MKRQAVSVENLLQIYSPAASEPNRVAIELADENVSLSRIRATWFPRREKVFLSRTTLQWFDTKFAQLYEIPKLRPKTSYRYLYVPPSLVEEIDVKSVVETAQPVLDSQMKNRYLIINSTIYLYYPELVITNSIGESHKITDLVVAIDTTEENLTGSILGKRYSLTTKELEVGYRHSHLPSAYNNFQKFCRGGGSPVDNFFTSLTNKPVEEFDVEVMLATLENYLVWESREGTPHIYLSKLYTVRETTDFASLFNSNNVDKAALWLLNQPNIEQFFVARNGVISITTNPIVLDSFYELELKMIQELNFPSDVLLDYDTVINSYVVNSNTSRTINKEEQLKSILGTELDKKIVKHFNIKARIYNAAEEIKTNSVKRISPIDFSKILDKLVLLVNTSTPTNNGTN